MTQHDREIGHPMRPRSPGLYQVDRRARWASASSSKFTLNFAAQQTIAQHPHAGYFSAGPSLLIVAAYAAAAIATAAFVTSRWDA